ncbi:MAG TPA: hypothetical protein VJB64_02995 [Patescibacteria group bacterium]|nr:hypothetical protein [Patescibacteria group bacterium]
MDHFEKSLKKFGPIRAVEMLAEDKEINPSIVLFDHQPKKNAKTRVELEH